MSLLPQTASYHELVQDCFLAFRGAGLMLSPLDAELIDAWATDGVPFEVVARGIRRAAEAALFDARPGEQSLRSLRACRRAIEAEIRKHRGKSAGRSEQAAEPADSSEVAPELKRHRKAAAALRKIARDHPAMALGVQRLLDGLLATPPANLTEAAAREQALDVMLVRALPWSDRWGLLREARQMAQEAASLSRRARKTSRRFHRAALLRRRLDLPPYW